MKYLLDTNTCIRYLNRRSQSVIERLESINEADVVICSIVKGELYLGAMKSQTPEATMLKQSRFAERFVSLPFDDDASLIYARIRAELEVAGTPIGSNDMMIAAIAVLHDLTVVTHNQKEFSRIRHLKITDWEL